MVWREDGFLRWVRRFTKYTTDYEPEQRVLSQSPDWEETTTFYDPPGVRTFQRFVTAEIGDDGVVHVVDNPAVVENTARMHLEYEIALHRQARLAREKYERLKSELDAYNAFTGEYCDQ